MASTSSILSLSFECMLTLDAIFDRIERSVGHEHGLKDSIEDDRGRFRVWAANLGALHPVKSPKSLDFRLRDASRMRASVISGLNRLANAGERVLGILSGEQPNRSAVTTQDVSSSKIGEVTEGTTELKELRLSIRSSVNHLFALSVLIRRQRPKGRLPSLEDFTPLDSSPDISNVTDKFPKVKERPWLAKRLGNAVTRRRQLIQYRQAHRQRLATKQNQGNLTSPGDADAGETIATSYEEDEERQYESNLSLLKERQSIFTSATSFISTYDENGNMGRRIPDLSDMILDTVRLRYGVPFECPYCRTIHTVQNRAEWKRHVFEDLQPYVCTFEDCLPSLFSSRYEWLEHEINAHRRKWHCNLCNKPSAIYGNEIDLRNHFDKFHPGYYTENQMSLVLQACERPSRYFDASSCPICDEWKPSQIEINSLKRFGQHLARHLQQIALEALPLSIEGLELIDELLLTVEDVAKHDKKRDMYLIVHNNVYDVTTFIDEHPGGEEVLLDVAGTDATEAFEDVGHSDEAREILRDLKIGVFHSGKAPVT